MDRNLRLLGIGVAVRTFGSALYSPFLALFLRNALGVSYLGIGVIFVGVGFVQLPFSYLGGLLTDRVGRRRLILLGLAGETVMTALLALAFAERSLAGAIGAAAVGGIVVSVAGAAQSAYIADLAAGAARTRGFTWYRIGFNAGYSAGVALGGLLVGTLGFAGAVALATAGIGAATALLAVGLGPSPLDAALAGGGRAPPGASDSAPLPARSVGASLRLLARDRAALELLLAFGLAALVVGQWGVTFPLFVHNVLGISYAILGAGLALNGIVVVFGQSATTERVLGRRHTTIANLGLAFYAVALVGLGAAGTLGALPVAVFFVAVLLLTVGENLVTIPGATLPSNLAPAGEIGAYNGIFGAVVAAGSIVAVYLGGLVLTATSDPLLVQLLLILPALPAALLFRDAARRLPASVDRA